MNDLKPRTQKFALDLILRSPRAELATNPHLELNRLLKEANELTAILVTSRKRARE
jgi:hypothetical protein